MNTEIAEKIAEPIQSAVPPPPQDGHPWQIGKTYVIRTVTMIQHGTVTAVYQNEIVLDGASWIADTGRFYEFLKNPQTRVESEPFTHLCIIGRGSIVDAQIVPDGRLGQK